MSRPVTIVMYHYVRELAHSRFPAIKGLSLERFRRQLDHIQANYTPVAVEDLIAALGPGGRDLPPRALLLTFDDAYTDHYVNVLPALLARGIRGCFFPPAQAVLEHVVLDVNKIHFILASAGDPGRLLAEVVALMEDFRADYDLAPARRYLQTAPADHRFDPREVVVIKRLLQRELPPPVRNEIVRRLFAEHVTTDETAFARELYMSADQLAGLRRAGMHVGSHGFSHAWLDRLDPAGQAAEIDRSLAFLDALGASRDSWTICYPYGGYNASLLDLLRARRCRLGFGVTPRVADLDADEPLALPRVDTNDLPS